MAKLKETQSKIESWRHGSAGFLKWLEDVQPRIPSEKGRLQVFEIPNQKVKDEIVKALDGDYSTICFCWPRRHGKTIMSALIIVWRFTCRTHQQIAMVSNSERQTTDTAFKLVRTILQNTPYFQPMIKSEQIKIQADRIHYDVASNIIQGFPSSPAALFGKKLSVCQVSELHAARNDHIYQALASSIIDSDDGLVLVDSTVGPRSSPLYHLYQLFENDLDPALYFSHLYYNDITDAVNTGPHWISEKKLLSRAAQMLPAEFAQQHLNLWTAASNTLFPPEILEKCTHEYPLDVQAITNGANYKTGSGLDRAYGFSKHGDNTVTTCIVKTIEGEDEHIYVLASDKIDFSSANGIKTKLTEYQKLHGMSKCVLEHYNAQDVSAWCSEQTFDSEVVYPTADKQSNAFTSLYQCAAEGRLHIHPSFTDLIAELGNIEYRLETEKNSTIAKFQAPKGGRDDFVYSLVWSLYSLRDEELNPYNMPGIHCNAIGPVARLCVMNGGNDIPMCEDSCRSMSHAKSLYSQYLERAGMCPLKFPDFFRTKVKNKGPHVVRR